MPKEALFTHCNLSQYQTAYHSTLMASPNLRNDTRHVAFSILWITHFFQIIGLIRDLHSKIRLQQRLSILSRYAQSINGPSYFLVRPSKILQAQLVHRCVSLS